MKIWIAITVLFLIPFCVEATKLEVVRFKANEDDQTALKEHRFDKQKQMCALIKIRSSVRNILFTGNPSITEQKPNPDSTGYYVYVSPKQTVLTIKTAGSEPLKYQTPFLQSGRVYEMEIIASEYTQEDEKGTIYIKSNPSAKIFLNDSSCGNTPRFLTALKTGNYKLCLKAEGYKDYVNNNVVVRENETTELSVNLISIGGRQPSTPASPAATAKKAKTKKPQDNGWYAGVSIGAVFPNKYTANYYNGDKDNYNSIYYLLSEYYNQNIYKDITDAIGHDFDTSKIGTPSDMAYKVTANFGLYGGYIFKKKNRILLSVDYHRLKTNDVLMLYFIEGTSIGNEVGTQCSITGAEDRFRINLGYSREFRAGEFTTWYLMGGVDINTVIARSNDIHIPRKNTSDKLKYSLLRNPLNPDGTAYTDAVKGGTGFGLFAAAGFRLKFSDKFSIDPEVQFSYSKVNISGYYKNLSYTHYDKFKPYLQLNVRLNLYTGWGKSKNSNTDAD